MIGLCFSADFFDKSFVCSMEHELIIDVVRRAKQHTFLVLTKQPQNVPPEFPFPRNLWLGVSVNRERDDWRIDKLREIDVAKRVVSFEPLLEPMNADLTNIDWIIIGAQTRPNFQPKPKWVESLIQCARIFGSKIFLKSNLFPQPTVNPLQEFPVA